MSKNIYLRCPSIDLFFCFCYLSLNGFYNSLMWNITYGKSLIVKYAQHATHKFYVHHTNVLNAFRISQERWRYAGHTLSHDCIRYAYAGYKLWISYSYVIIRYAFVQCVSNTLWVRPEQDSSRFLKSIFSICQRFGYFFMRCAYTV